LTFSAPSPFIYGRKEKRRMKKSLAVLVSSDKHLDKILKLCEAAKKKEVRVALFFTHRGLLLTKDPRFQELEGVEHLSCCKVGLEGHGLAPPSLLGEKGLGTQAVHAEMIADCDRHLVF
jgi:hypothetical protein